MVTRKEAYCPIDYTSHPNFNNWLLQLCIYNGDVYLIPTDFGGRVINPQEPAVPVQLTTLPKSDELRNWLARRGYRIVGNKVEYDRVLHDAETLKLSKLVV